ncbi:hypothetical protein HYFRA_00002165 [Hymenoscyphus fraxineus]|uniref:Uncharacterized protein n=1 Tax=Hymenoscyphus fraxineus TaxID=746836 RepID=A0A9N9KN57_9HELO|nr:hypothetical protein HYFRA_00002165 [Hymenoscyphus fraxineus]
MNSLFTFCAKLNFMFKLLTNVIAFTSFSNVLATPQEYNGGYSSAATCTPKSAGKEGTDDVPAIVEAIKSCGKGGIIVLSA